MSSSSKRPQFRPGEPPTAEGFQMEQDFHIRQRELCNKALSGWGIIGDGFQLEYDSTLQRAKVSSGTAIGPDGQSLLSDDSLESPIFYPSDNVRFAVVYIQRTSEGCDETLSIDGENDVWTSWEDQTVLKIELLAGETITEDQVKALTPKGCVVVGSLEKLDGKWKSSNKFRQQGPIDPPGGKDAARIANAISVNGFGQRQSSRRTRDLLFWLGTAATAAMLLASLLWIWIWYSKYFVPPQVPYSVAIEDGKDLQGPIAGETYGPNEFSVVVKDQFGKPIKGILVEYKLADVTPDTGNTVTSNAVKSPVSALFVEGISKTNVPDIVRVVTDSNGKASPGKIRFAGLPKTGVTNAESVKLSIAFPEADIDPINRLLTPVSKKCTQVRLIGNFSHLPELIDTTTPIVTGIPEVHRVNEKFQIRAQALNVEHPISVTELNATCRIRKRTPQDGDPALPTDGSGQFPSLSVKADAFPSTLEKEFAAVIGQRGENSWITFDVSCESEGVYRARIDVVLDSVTTTKDLYFLVVK
jgi:hypothetical protein